MLVGTAEDDVFATNPSTRKSSSGSRRQTDATIISKLVTQRLNRTFRGRGVGKSDQILAINCRRLSEPATLATDA